MPDIFPELNETILVVDDDPTNLRFLQEILKNDYKVYAALSAERALSFLEKHTPHLILLDIEMPGMNGYEMIKRLKSDHRWTEIPVIFLTAQEGRDKEQLAFKLGAVDYVLKPISSGVVISRVGLHMELERYKKDLERLVELKTAQLQRTQDSILDILANVTAYRDNETGAHIKRTTVYAQYIVENLISKKHPDYFMTKEYAENVHKSAKLHDIGKVGVPDGILLKPAKLTPIEFEIIKGHTSLGAQILDDAIDELGDTSSFLNVAREIVISHHEKWNGTGYPNGISGHDIPLSGRIMAITDVYDALVSARPYKVAFTHEEATRIMYGDSGTHFDPTLMELSREVIDRFPDVAKLYRDENYVMRMLGSTTKEAERG